MFVTLTSKLVFWCLFKIVILKNTVVLVPKKLKITPLKLFILTFIFCYSLINNSLFSQLISLNIQQQYDEIVTEFVDVRYNPCNITQKNIPEVYGDGMSYILESYLIMYQSTKDENYLLRFINQVICMQENRQDSRGFSLHPRWAVDPSMYHDGLILWPMCHFINQLTIIDSTLLNHELPQNESTKITTNNFKKTFKTYREFTHWLEERTTQTVDWYIYGNANTDFKNFWADDTRCFTPSQNPKKNSRAQAINMQAAFGCALFYLGEATADKYYLQKARKIALAYKGTREEKQSIGPKFNPCLLKATRNLPVLVLLENNSYIWKSYGWRAVNCGDFQNDDNDFEDLSHAIQTLIFPIAISNRLKNEGKFLFGDAEMIRFKNTLTKNVFAGNVDGCPQFHAAIDGDDTLNYNSYFNGFNSSNIRTLSWMSLADFDETNADPKLYEIIMNFYQCSVAGNNKIISAGLDIFGLAHVAAACRKRERLINNN